MNEEKEALHAAIAKVFGAISECNEPEQHTNILLEMLQALRLKGEASKKAADTELKTFMCPDDSHESELQICQVRRQCTVAVGLIKDKSCFDLSQHLKTLPPLLVEKEDVTT